MRCFAAVRLDHRDRLLGDDQHVHRRLRRHVVERQHLKAVRSSSTAAKPPLRTGHKRRRSAHRVVLVRNLGRDLLPDDLRRRESGVSASATAMSSRVQISHLSKDGVATGRCDLSLCDLTHAAALRSGRCYSWYRDQRVGAEAQACECGVCRQRDHALPVKKEKAAASQLSRRA